MPEDKIDSPKILKARYIQAYSKLIPSHKQIMNTMTSMRCDSAEAARYCGHAKTYMATLSRSKTFQEALSCYNALAGNAAADRVVENEVEVNTHKLWDEKDAKQWILARLEEKEISMATKTRLLELLAKMNGWIQGGKKDKSDSDDALLREIRKRIPIRRVEHEEAEEDKTQVAK